MDMKPRDVQVMKPGDVQVQGYKKLFLGVRVQERLKQLAEKCLFYLRMLALRAQMCRRQGRIKPISMATDPFAAMMSETLLTAVGSRKR